MDIGIIGTGDLAARLGSAWAGAGHRILVAGRDQERALHAAARIGDGASAVGLADLAELTDVVVIAVAWDGLENVLTLAGAHSGSLEGKTVIECTNAVDYSTGKLKPRSGSAAEFVADRSPGAHVVKALHLFAGASWPYSGPEGQQPVVAICGDDRTALDVVSSLVHDLGGVAAVVGGLDSARQLEDAAGFVMRVVASGHNPRLAVPDVTPAALGSR